jgi:serine/threonine-protein kinase
MLRTNDELFNQELSVHELFRKEKYFAKLICYSETPHQIVLKYYNYGSLHSFLYLPKPLDIPVRYSLILSLHLAERIAYAVHLMHCKGYIHNDLKPPNILLDGDNEDPLFPVITDFGLVNILNTANIASGFKINNLKGGTYEYCAPELLKSFKNKILISNVETDMYAFGIVLEPKRK